VVTLCSKLTKNSENQSDSQFEVNPDKFGEKREDINVG
jgi:hypothetical protein